MPGRILQSIKKAKTSNPVFILDEIDKLSKDFRGDPSSALLEVLHPEQNSTFHDNYLDIDYDLSKVMFIATANSLSTIQPALLDRMEIIDISGYSLEEKIEISKRHLVPKQVAEHGLKEKDVNLSSQMLQFITQKYTRESGVRSLDRTLAGVMRSVAKKVAMNESYHTKPLALAVASVGAFVSLAWLGATGRLPVPLVVVLQGLAAFASFTPMHDASHRSVARAAPLNEFVGWVTALVLTAPFPAFRHLHLEHHRNTNDPVRDPDMWSGAGGPWSRLFRWATQDIAYYVFYAKRAKERPRAEVFGTFVGLVLTYAPMVALAALGHGREALLCWAVPARLGIILFAFAFDLVIEDPLHKETVELKRITQ